MTRTTSTLQTAMLDTSLAEQWTLHHVLLDRLDRECFYVVAIDEGQQNES